MKVLIVDDDIHELELLVEIIKNLGHSVWKSETYRNALDKLNKQAFDLVLLDIFLPDELGYKMIPFIKNNNSETNIVMMTGSNSRELEAKVRQIGNINYYLIKPYELKVLETIINHIDIRQIDKLRA